MNEYRHQPLLDQWVLIAPNRAKHYTVMTAVSGAPNLENPFLPGNEGKTPQEIYRVADGKGGWKVRVFPNRFPLLSLESPNRPFLRDGVERKGGFGAHEMVIDSAQPDLRLCDFDADRLQNLFTAFRDRIAALHRDQRIQSVIAVKNQGFASGNTIPHSHSQVVGLGFIPPMLALQMRTSRDHYQRTGRSLLGDLLEQESQSPRLLGENRYFAAFFPAASRYPFETWIVPKEQHHDFSTSEEEMLHALGHLGRVVLDKLGRALDKPDLTLQLFTAPPVREHPDPAYYHHMDRFFRWHLQLIPRFTPCDGVELATGIAINPVAPETAADYLTKL